MKIQREEGKQLLYQSNISSPADVSNRLTANNLHLEFAATKRPT